jgi:hypothetical protein
MNGLGLGPKPGPPGPKPGPPEPKPGPPGPKPGPPIPKLGTAFAAGITPGAHGLQQLIC